MYVKRKEKKERNNGYTKLEKDEEDLYTLKITCKGEEQQGRQRNKCRKNILVLKNQKYKKEKGNTKGEKKEEERKKENSTELQKPNIEAEVYNNNKK